MEKDKIEGCLIGVAVGDALGAPFEGRNPSVFSRSIQRAGGLITDFCPFMGKTGAWTDDTGMTLAACRALIEFERTGKLMHQCFREAFNIWINSDESRNAGKTVTHAAKYGVPDLNSWASGALMRTSPAAIYAYLKGYSVRDAADLAFGIAGLTHGHPMATFPAVESTLALLSIFRGEPCVPIYLSNPGALISNPNAEHKRECIQYQELRNAPSNELNPSSALFMWKQVFEDCLGLKTGRPWRTLPPFEEGILQTVNTCLDRDTAGAVAGAILGAYWGLQAIPERWRSQVEKAKQIRVLASELIIKARRFPWINDDQ